MNSFNLKSIFSIAFSVLLFGASVTYSQSSDQNYPTPVTSSEIQGKIKARDIGDSRLTVHYYTFNGTQGDIFINVVTTNFNGDIDVYLADGLKSLTKMVVYSDSGPNETGRLIYLRKPEKLLLRIEGRTPGDDPATYRIKFAGSFVAMTPTKYDESGNVPKVSKSETEEDVKVNSVGTIIEQPKKPQDKVSPPADSKSERSTQIESKASDNAKKNEAVPDKPLKDAEKVAKQTEKTVATASKKETENKAVDSAKIPSEKTPPPPRRNVETAKNEKNTTNKPPEGKVVTPPTENAKKPAPPKKPVNPMEKVELKIYFKDGRVIVFPMMEISNFNVVDGVLTVTNREGIVARYSFPEVSRVAIQ